LPALLWLQLVRQSGLDGAGAGPLWPGELAFARDALMFLTGTLDAILELAPIVRELFGHFVGSPGHIAAYDGPEANDLTDVEFV
jgi:hypothetical protein